MERDELDLAVWITCVCIYQLSDDLSCNVQINLNIYLPEVRSDPNSGVIDGAGMKCTCIDFLYKLLYQMDPNSWVGFVRTVQLMTRIVFIQLIALPPKKKIKRGKQYLTEKEKKNPRHSFLHEKENRCKLQAAKKLVILCWEPPPFRPHMFSGVYIEQTHHP